MSIDIKKYVLPIGKLETNVKRHNLFFSHLENNRAL